MGQHRHSSLDPSVVSIISVSGVSLANQVIGADFIHSLMGEATEYVAHLFLKAADLMVLAGQPLEPSKRYRSHPKNE